MRSYDLNLYKLLIYLRFSSKVWITHLVNSCRSTDKVKYIVGTVITTTRLRSYRL